MDWQTFPHNLDSNLARWLTEPQNLTVCLQQALPAIQFQRLGSAWQPATASELQFLEHPGRIWRREIIHHEGAKVWVYAYVSVPERTYLQYQSSFEELGNKPIGSNLLYITPGITRSGFHYKQLTRLEAPEAMQRLGQDDSYWARCSCFDWSGYPLLITECFQTAMPEYPTPALS